MEYLLTLATARGDTNPLAHKLLNKFGSISNIVNSNYTQLLAIKGIGPKIASFLLSYGKILHFVFETGAMPKKKTVLQTINQFSEVLRNYFLGKTCEEFYVLLLTAKSELIGVERITTGNVNSVGIDVPSFVQTVLQHNASIIVIAHNHPNGELQPSGEDIDATLAIVEAISVYGVRVADHLIIGPKQVFSFKYAGLLDQIIEARAHKNHAFSNRLYGFSPNSSGIIDLTPTPFETKPDYLNPIIDS